MKKHSSSRKLSSPCYTVGRPTIQTFTFNAPLINALQFHFGALLALLFDVLLALLFGVLLALLFGVLLALLFGVLLALLCFDLGKYGSNVVEVRFSHTKVRRDTNNHHGRMRTFPNVTTLQYLQY